MPKHSEITNLFDNIAPQYDRLNHLMSFDMDKLWRRKAVRKAVDTEDHLRILDVATGTGDLAIALAERAGGSSTVAGLDPSEKMLEVAQQKILELGMSHKIEFIKGHSEALPFEDCTFDRVAVAFGIRNFEDLELGFSEMCRVLRPGGRLVMLELSYPDNRLLQWGFRQYALRWLPYVGGRISGNAGAYRYLPESILRFPKPEVLLPKLRAAGFSKANAKSMTFGVCRMYVAEK